MSLHDCIEETLQQCMDDLAITLTPEELKAISSDIEVSVEMHYELSSYQHDYDPEEQYRDKIKNLEKEMSSMHSKGSYNELENRLDDHKQEIRRLHEVIDNLEQRLRNC